jgi:hypothetical protein
VPPRCITEPTWLTNARAGSSFKPDERTEEVRSPGNCARQQARYNQTGCCSAMRYGKSAIKIVHPAKDFQVMRVGQANARIGSRPERGPAFAERQIGGIEYEP